MVHFRCRRMSRRLLLLLCMRSPSLLRSWRELVAINTRVSLLGARRVAICHVAVCECMM